MKKQKIFDKKHRNYISLVLILNLFFNMLGQTVVSAEDITHTDSSSTNQQKLVDITAPIVDIPSIKVSHTEAIPGDRLKVSLKATDNLSGIEKLEISYRKPISKKLEYIYLNYNKNSGEYEGYINITHEYESGLWKIACIYISDYRGNSNWIHNIGIYENYSGPNFEDLSGGNFTVSGTVLNVDLIAPIVDTSSIKVSRTEAIPGDRIKISLKATDNSSGIKLLEIYYRKPISENREYIHLNYNKNSGEYEGYINITDEYESGLWKIEDIYISDSEGNSKVISNSEIYAGSDDFKDLSGGNFTVNGTGYNVDVIAPIVDISSIKVSRTEVIPGDRIKISLKATDNLSGIEKLEISYRKPISGNLESGTFEYIRLNYNKNSGEYEGYINITDEYESGLWRIDFIYFSDYRGNYNYINNIEIYQNYDTPGYEDLRKGNFTVSGTELNVDVKDVSLNKSKLSITKGKTSTLIATVSPNNATNKSLMWTSSNTKVATVDSNGKVIAVAPGTTTITVKTKDGFKTAKCEVTVLNVFNTLKINTVTKNTTTIKGTGVKGAKVTAYVSGKSVGSATVAKDGSYSIKISKQSVGKEITIKMTKSGYATKTTTTKVLNVFNTLKVNTVTKNTTTIKGTGIKGAKVTAYVSGKSIGSATVAKDGSYSIKISKQSAGKEITIKMTKSGYATKSTTTKVLNVFNTLKVNSVTKNTATIKGTGVKGAKVTAYVGGKSIGSATVAKDGSYSIKISKQSAGKEITIKMTKSGYASKSTTTKVLNVFNTLKVNTITKNTTTIKGTGVKGSKVTAYVGGKSIGSATVGKDGSYSIKISKQSAGKEIMIKMTKSGYATKSTTTKVLKVFNTLKVNTVTKNMTTIKGTGVKGAKVTAYVSGKSIGSATVAKDGSYSIKISKQSAGKEITIKMTKSGYATKSINTKVKK